MCFQADSADAESTQAQFDQAYQKLKIQIQDAIVQQVLVCCLIGVDGIVTVGIYRLQTTFSMSVRLWLF